MKYLFDTDHLSILQKSTGQDYDNLSRRMEKIPISDFAISIVTVHEQLLGSHTYINRARDETQLLIQVASYSFLVLQRGKGKGKREKSRNVVGIFPLTFTLSPFPKF